MSSTQLALVLTTIMIVLVAAHTLAFAFSRVRQPAVIGEILAGLLLGPTVLGLLAPGLHGDLFPSEGPAAGVLQALAQLGLLLLMFVTGAEMRVSSVGSDRRTVGIVAVAGLVLPLGVGLGVARLLDSGDFTGPAGSPLTFGLVFGIAVAVTSIPVISRIMLDLGMLGTPFARVVLSVAALEDIVLYGVLAVVLSLAHTSGAEGIGFWSLLGTDSTTASVAYHVTASLLVFVVGLTVGPILVRRMLDSRWNVIESRSPAAFRLTLLLGSVLCCALLDVNPIFGALLAGFALRRAEQDRPPGPGAESTQVIRQFSLAFFIPIYFLGVGLALDLVRDFAPVFFLVFLLLCCAAKLSSVWAGARLAGRPGRESLDLAVALNARGGPGIVLATVTLAAGVINDRFFTSLVLLSVVTSQFAGIWLDRRLTAIRPDPAESAEPAELPVGRSTSGEQEP